MGTKKFIYFLAEAPNYPNEIFASSANEVKKMILENIPDESQIIKIIEVKEKPEQKQTNIEKAISADPDDYKNGKDFFNDIVQNASKVKNTSPSSSVNFIEEELKPSEEKNEQRLDINPIKSAEESMKKSPPRFFEESGIQFKFDNGELFKKAWVNAPLDEYRIINKKTNKIVSDDKFMIEKIEWVKIE